MNMHEKQQVKSIYNTLASRMGWKEINEISNAKDISQSLPIKMILKPTGKMLPRPVMKSVQSLGLDGKIQTREIYDAQNLDTRICRAYYKFCIGVKLGQKSRKLLLKYNLLEFVAQQPICQESLQ